MNHQTKNRNFVSTLEACAVLATGIAMCTWLGSNMNNAHHVFQAESGSGTGMMHLIKMPNAANSRLMATPKMDDKFNIDVGKKGNEEFAGKAGNNPGTVRAAIYTMPNLKSANKKHKNSNDIII